jgi:hypothetical protein
MSKEEKVSVTISIDKSYKDKLRIIAAKLNLRDPNQVTSASTLAKEIICGCLDKLTSEEIEENRGVFENE